MLRILFSEIGKRDRGPAIFIDRDGVINERRPDDYVLAWSQFVFVPGIREALKQIATLGLPMIVISNQAAVGKGLLTLDGLREITKQMQQALLEDGVAVSAAYYCPHRIEDDCVCRKPKAALLLKAAEDFDIDLSHSIFIGDSTSDVEAARAAGARPLVFGTGQNMTLRDSSVGELAIARAAEELFDSAIERLSSNGSPKHEASQRQR